MENFSSLLATNHGNECTWKVTRTNTLFYTDAILHNYIKVGQIHENKGSHLYMICELEPYIQQTLFNNA